MHIRTLMVMVGGLVTLALSLFEVQTAYACSCVPPNVRSSYAFSSDVLRGQILWRFERRTQVVYVVRVTDVFKGCHLPGETVRIVTDVSTAACGIPDLHRHGDYLFTASIGEHGTLRIHLCGYNIPFSHLAEQEHRFLEKKQPRACAEHPCASSTQCTEGYFCTTEEGVCNPPPGCIPGRLCAAVCYGTCMSLP